MSTQAKYGWAIGLIFAGIVGALPFRHHNPSSHDSSSQVAKKDEATGPNESSADAKNESSNDESKSPNRNTGKPGLNNSRLLPNQPKSIAQFDELNRSQAPRVESNQNPNRSAPQIVEQVPKKLDFKKLPQTGSKNILESEETKREPVAKLGPVDVADPPVKREMPRNVGPYRMKPVPNSKFRSASQSGSSGNFSRASRTRKVIQYKLRDGDSLRSIAQRYLGDESRYEEILADNRHLLTNGEKFLPVGQYITIIVQ